MLARANKGKKVPAKSEAVRAAEAEAALNKGKKGKAVGTFNQAPTKGGKIIENF